MEVQQARKRPLLVSYVEMTEDNGAEVAEWCGGEWRPETGEVLVPTIHGQIPARPDGLRYVIHGTHEEYYPIRADVFAAIYGPDDAPPEMRLTFDDSDPVAECHCGWRWHGDSINDAVVGWAAHAVRLHRELL